MAVKKLSSIASADNNVVLVHVHNNKMHIEAQFTFGGTMQYYSSSKKSSRGGSIVLNDNDLAWGVRPPLCPCIG